MVLRGALAETLLAIGARRDHFAGAIGVDPGRRQNAEPSAMQELNRYALPGAIRLPFDTDIGIVRAVMRRCRCASADAVLFLSNDVEPAPR